MRKTRRNGLGVVVALVPAASLACGEARAQLSLPYTGKNFKATINLPAPVRHQQVYVNRYRAITYPAQPMIGGVSTGV